MNILDYINQSERVVALHIDHDGKKVDFHIKNLTQEEVEEMSGEQVELLPIHKKQEKGETLTPEEMKQMLAYQSDQAYHVLCTEAGDPLFSSKEELKKAIPGRLFKAISEKIAKYNGIEEAEKN